VFGQVTVTGLAAVIDPANPMSREEALAIGIAAGAEELQFWGNDVGGGDRSSNVELVFTIGPFTREGVE
jgi:hypothetical protein